MPVTFHQHRSQETSFKAMLQAIKLQMWGQGVPHGCAQMGKNNQNPENGIALLMVGGKGFQRMPVTFLQHRFKEIIPRAMLQAIKVQIWG